MSIVANQYNLIAESLRRGIAGLNQGRLQEASLQAGMKKFELESEMRNRQMILEEEQNRRANQAEQRAQDLFPAQKEAAELSVKSAKQGIEKTRLEMPGLQMNYQLQQDKLRKWNTPASEKSVRQLFQSRHLPGMTNGPGGEIYLDESLKMAGYTFENGRAFKDGKEMNEYQVEQDKDLNIVQGFLDPMEALVGMKQQAEMERMQASNAGDNDALLKYDKVLGYVDKKIKEIEKDPVGTLEKQFNYALAATMASDTPEKYIPAVKLLQAKLAASVSGSGSGTWSTKTMYNSANGDSQSLLFNNKNPHSFLIQYNALYKMGYRPEKQGVEDIAAMGLNKLQADPSYMMTIAELKAMQTTAKTLGITDTELIRQQIGLDPKVLEIRSKVQMGELPAQALTEYQQKQERQLTDSYNKAREKWAEELRTGKDTPGTTDAARIERLKATTEAQAKELYRTEQWSPEQYLEWKRIQAGK